MPSFRKVLDGAVKLVGERHPYYLMLLGQYAGIQKECGDADGAEASIRRVLDLGVRSPLRWHPLAAKMQREFALHLQNRARPEDLTKAESLHRSSLEI